MINFFVGAVFGFVMCLLIEYVFAKIYMKKKNKDKKGDSKWVKY